jgi:small subunit ribosomal protein S9
MADDEQTPPPENENAENGGAPDAQDAAEPATEASEEQSAQAPSEESAASAAEPDAESALAEADSAPEEPAGEPAEEPAAEPAAESSEAPAEPAAATADASEGEEEAEDESAPRVKPAVPGAHLEVDIVPEGVDPLDSAEEYVDRYAIEDEEEEAVAETVEDSDRQDEALSEPIATAAIDLAAGARYRATGKRKTAIARVTLRPGSGTYLVNGRSLEEHFPRATLQRNIRQPLETVGYQERMDVVARLHGGGISAQAGALRHGVSRALLEADPNLRGELKRRGFLTRDSRAKERKKAGLKKARKRPQFSKR